MALTCGILQADQIDGNDRNLLRSRGEHHRAGEERIVNALGRRFIP